MGRTFEPSRVDGGEQEITNTPWDRSLLLTPAPGLPRKGAVAISVADGYVETDHGLRCQHRHCRPRNAPLVDNPMLLAMNSDSGPTRRPVVTVDAELAHILVVTPGNVQLTAVLSVPVGQHRAVDDNRLVDHLHGDQQGPLGVLVDAELRLQILPIDRMATVGGP